MLRARVLIVLAVGGVVLAGTTACSGAEDDGTIGGTDATAVATSGVPAATATPAQSATSAPVREAQIAQPTATVSGFALAVFFSKHTESDDRPSAVFPVDRVSPDAGVARFSIAELLAGPTPAEATAGYFSTWTQFAYGDESNCGGDRYAVVIEGGVATVQFCTTVTLLGVVADGQALSALNATLEQFSTIDRVVVLDSRGHCMFDLSGLDLCLQER